MSRSLLCKFSATAPGIFVIIVCAITIAATSDSPGDLGIDAKQLISVDEFKCLKNEGYTFFTAHLLHSRSGRYDKNGMQNLKNALAGICSMWWCPSMQDYARAKHYGQYESLSVGNKRSALFYTGFTTCACPSTQRVDLLWSQS